MKKLFFLTAIFAALTMSAFAQAKPTDFSGTWTLDLAKSQLGERARVEAMTLTVAQTAKDLTVSTETKRPGPPADAAQAATPGRGMGRGGFGDGSVVYSLEGKETIVEIDGPNGKLPVKYKATLEAGKANLSSSRSFTGPMGEITATTKEGWSLSPDGKTLTVVREQSSPRGASTSTMVFVKK